ncbi:hypothetical protein MUG84_14345 [Paenibacillus sp. KQZ6P-2]|uniref:Uncharacterized protein n=1 Tax=Paenibacillus mangrovi TaxID=2931978 RepID=A0A9X2B2U5_9BACL|nr:hypothetical protein [Paenibacillus mangrovi]MCJ8012914.1 hypothetical protein [Paenibacillus mangrovi]
MNKAQHMDAFLHSFEGEVTGDVIHKVVLQTFGIDLDAVSLLTEAEKEALAAAQDTQTEIETIAASSSRLLPRHVIDSQLTVYNGQITGPAIRAMLNHLFGVNLDAISSLEKSRISLFSKQQWIVQHERDLFVVYTGEGDVDVRVYPTVYYKEQTGMDGLPEDLQIALKGLGYQFDVDMNGFYFVNPDGQAVPDAFKGQTMGAIMATIGNSCSHL